MYENNFYSANNDNNLEHPSTYEATFGPNPVYPDYQPTEPSPSSGKPPKKGKARKIVAIALAAGLVGGAAFQGGSYATKSLLANVGSQSESSVTESSQGTESDGGLSSVILRTDEDGDDITSPVTEVVENAMPSMVSINVTIKTQVQGYWGYGAYEYESTGSGSGIIIGQDDNNLYIATNNHVVKDASDIAVSFVDGSSYEATVKGTDASADLAVITIPLSTISSDTLSQIKVAVLGDSDSLKLGEPAIAIGNALGYGQSVTVGYISATAREVQMTDGTMTLIQTDAAINPGNSGGALLNIDGEVIGINSAKYSDTDVEGMGFAIPISTAIPIINGIIQQETVPETEKAYFGINGTSVPSVYQLRFGWPEGVYVSFVAENSPAALAGIQSGDIIVSYNQTALTSIEELQSLIEQSKAGDTVSVTLKRQGQNGTFTETTVTVTLSSTSQSE